MPAAAPPDAPPVAVAYVMTDYPRLAMTFITGEIDEIRRSGGVVVPVAMNRPNDTERLTAEGRAREADCRYLKSPAVFGAVARLVGRRPLGAARLGWRALRTGPGAPAAVLRRLVHLAYGAVIVEHCRARGVFHLHAHFGQSPATIAWFAAWVGNLEPTERWTWSVTIHGQDVVTGPHDVPLEPKVADAAVIVTVSDSTRSQVLRASRPTDWPKVTIVRCGIDLEQFRQREGAPEVDIPVITTVGRLAAEKGQAVLVEAMALLRDRGVIARAEIIGGGPLERHLRTAIAEHGVAASVTLVGELAPSEVVRRLRASAVFCLPSFAEGLPVALMEAMAIGVPVVATHVNGIPELAIDGVSALTVAPGSAEQLAAALGATLADPTAAADRVGAARRLVEVHHAQRTNVAQLCELFRAVGTRRG